MLKKQILIYFNLTKKAYKTFENGINVYEPNFFENIFDSVDLNKNGKVDYHGKKKYTIFNYFHTISEFLLALIDKNNEITNENIMKTFNLMDKVFNYIEKLLI